LVLLVGLISTPCQGQSGRTLQHAEKGTLHSIWVPDGYEEVWWPESPNRKFGNEAREFQASTGMKNEYLAVLVRKKDLNAYYQGGAHPMQGHYIYIQWKAQGRMPTSAQTANEMNRAGGSPEKFREAINKGDQSAKQFIRDFVPVGTVYSLGILREWVDGYIAGMAVGLEMVFGGRRMKSAKFMSLGHQKRENGYYIVSCVTLQEYGSKLDAHLERTMLISKSLTNRALSR